MSNRSDGTQFEKIFCGMLANRGFWAHNMAQSQAGQPADIIAVKGHTVWLIDCKVCSNGRFDLKRIEPNQLTAMDAWTLKCEYEPYFACRLPDGAVFMIGYSLVMARLADNIMSLSEIDIRKQGIYFGAWCEGVTHL